MVAPSACPLGKLLPPADCSGMSTTGRSRPTSVFRVGLRMSPPTPHTTRNAADAHRRRISSTSTTTDTSAIRNVGPPRSVTILSTDTKVWCGETSALSSAAVVRSRRCNGPHFARTSNSSTPKQVPAATITARPSRLRAVKATAGFSCTRHSYPESERPRTPQRRRPAVRVEHEPVQFAGPGPGDGGQVRQHVLPQPPRWPGPLPPAGVPGIQVGGRAGERLERLHPVLEVVVGPVEVFAGQHEAKLAGVFTVVVEHRTAQLRVEGPRPHADVVRADHAPRVVDDADLRVHVHRGAGV